MVIMSWWIWIRLLAVLAGLVTICRAVVVSEAECTEIGKRTVVAALVYQKQTAWALDHFIGNYTDGQGYTLITTDSSDDSVTQCHRVEWRKVLIENGDLMAIYDTQVLKTLFIVDLIVGEYMRAIQVFADSVQKVYLVTTPFSTGRSIGLVKDAKEKTTYVARMWPSSASYIDALHVYAHKIATRKGSKDRITILYYTESIYGLQYVNVLHKSLGDQPTTSVDFVEIDQHLVSLVHHRFTEGYPFTVDQERLYQKQLKELREKVTRHHAVLILLYVDDPNKMDIIRVLFSKTADMERKNVPWIIADMFLPYQQKIRTELQELEVVKATVHMYVQNAYQDCLIASTVEERGIIWAYDVITERLGKMNTSDASFDYVEFRKLVMSTSDSVKGVSLNDYGDRINSIMFLNKILPHGFDDEPSCGTAMTGVFFYESPYKIVLGHEDVRFNRRQLAFKQHENGRLKFYGVRPRDEKKRKAVVVIDKPFVMVREGVDASVCSARGSECYEGIAIDIFEKAKQVLLQQGIKLDLDYDLENAYGMNQDGNWTGALGRLNDPDDPAVISLGQFSKTEEREEDFAFTSTFGYIQTTFIAQKRVGYFYMQFARPFSKIVWFWLMATMVASAMYIFMLDAWNPFKDNVENELRYNAKESIWFSFLTCFQVGAPFGAYMFPTRVFSVFYWFFAMVVVACYTGNLASFLSDEELIRPKISIDNLLHSDFAFGMVNQSSVASDFKNHRKPLYNKIYQTVYERDDFVANYEEGVQRVKEEKFVLIGTSGVLEFAKSSDEECSLITDNSPKYTRPSTEIAFVMTKDWEMAGEFNEAMQELMESGELQAIYRRWMKPGRVCGGDEEEDETVRLGFNNFLGLYIILVVMIIISFICLFFKLMHLWLRDNYNRKGDAKSPEETGTEMLNVNGNRASGSAPLADDETLDV